jgi:hypothetical protein
MVRPGRAEGLERLSHVRAPDGSARRVTGASHRSRLTAFAASALILLAGLGVSSCGGSSVSDATPKSTPEIVPPNDTAAEKEATETTSTSTTATTSGTSTTGEESTSGSTGGSEASGEGSEESSGSSESSSSGGTSAGGESEKSAGEKASSEKSSGSVGSSGGASAP